MERDPVHQFLDATSNEPHPTRWNRQLCKAFDEPEFDVSAAKFPAESAEEALVSQYLGVDIKHLERRTHRVMSVRMGAWLSATDAVITKWQQDDIRNLNWRGEETPPAYDTLQLNSREAADFLIDGMRFLRQPPAADRKSQRATLRVQPRWWGLEVTAYGLRTAGTAHHLLGDIHTAAAGINFLKGEAFSLSGEFLPTTDEGFADLFLDPTNAAAIERVVLLVNEKGAALENRGVLLMGPPGTGKTLSARIVRNQAKATFIWVSARDFHYMGSFGGFAEAFDMARECAPSVICFEDVDNWLYDGTVDLIKTEMDGIGRSSGVVTMMTTNYPELLPAALIDRPGRFHDVLKFDLPDADARLGMLRRWLPELAEADLTRAVEATAGYSGAHVRELTRFARIIGEQDGLPLEKALDAALTKLAEQRALIAATQGRQAHYRTPPALLTRAGVRTLVTKDFAPVDLGHATSQLIIKSFDEEQRILRGWATTPEPDRVGDIIEPLGVSFRDNIKLHLHHDKTKPVGTVKFGRPTADGVPFESKIPKIAEAGLLRDRVEEAWQSVKHGLLDSVSIGFRVVDGAYERLKTGGIRFLKTELLELSLVSVPANPGAAILHFKSASPSPPAAFGTAAGSGLSSPGVSGSSRRTAPKDARRMKTLAEQRAAFEATRATKQAKMVELMEKSGEAGLTLDEAQQQEYDDLDREVDGLNKHLARLDKLDGMALSQARPVAGGSIQEAAAARAGGNGNGSGVVVVPKKLEPGIMFARYVKCLAATRGNTMQALEFAKQQYPDDVPIHNVIKAAVAAGTTTDPTWAGALVDYQNFAGDFIDFLRPMTIIGKFGTGGIPSLTRVPFNIQVPGQTSGGDAWWVGEGKPKPVTSFAFENITLRWAKVANIAVLTEELVRFSNPAAETLTRNALAGAIIERIDRDFIDPTKAAVADVSPASITNGSVAIPSSGTEAIDIQTDVQAIFAPFIAANLTPTTGVWIMNATLALALSLMKNALGQPEYPTISMAGGTFQGLPVIVSQYVPSGIVVLVNASDIYLADDGQVVIDASREAALQMLDNPTNATADTASPPAPIPTSMVSLWQTNSVGLKAERFINWRRRRTDAVQYLSGVAWSAGSPA